MFQAPTNVQKIRICMVLEILKCEKTVKCLKSKKSLNINETEIN